MKNNETTDSLNVRILERIALESSVQVPENLEREIGNMIDSLDRAERILGGKEKVVRIRWHYVAAAASVILVCGFTFFRVMDSRKLVDTYDNPELAYAKLAESLRGVGMEIDYGTSCMYEGKELVDNQLKKIYDIINK